MPLQIFWTNDDTGTDETFTLDVVTQISHEDVTTITDHPVEEGVVISDHARDEPDFCSVEGIITNTPHAGNLTDDDVYQDQPLSLDFKTREQSGTTQMKLDVPSPPITATVDSLVGAGLGALKSAIFGGPEATMNTPSKEGSGNRTVTIPQPVTPRDRAREGYEKLLQAKGGHFLCVFDTGMRAYFDMLVTRIAEPRVVEDGESVKFQIDFRKIRLAETQTVQAPKPAEVRATKPKTLGSKTVKEDSAENQELHSHAYDAGVSAGLIH